MMMLFRGKYLAGIKKALAAGELVIPSNEREQSLLNLCNKLGRQDWVVHCAKAYEHGHGVAKYLARYIRGGAIKNSQLLHLGDAYIKLRYKSHQTQQTEYLHLTHAQFMQRLLSHIAIPKKSQYQMVGLYHGKCREKLNQARQSLGQIAVNEIKVLDWQSFVKRQGAVACCKQCGKILNQLRPLEKEMNLAVINSSTVH